MLPTPYDMRWTSRLICRDLKGLAARCTNRVRNLLSNTSGTLNTLRIEHKDTIMCALPQFNEDDFKPSVDAEAITDTTTPCTVPLSLSGTVADSNSTLPTEISQASPECPVTLYRLLSQKLECLYSSRERDLPHIERWVFRGAWLILHMATQYCASNPTHDVLNPGASRSNETALLLEILRKYFSFSECQLLTWVKEYSTSNPVKRNTSQVSQMRTVPFTESDATSRRHDSVYDTISKRCLSNPTSALFWYTIFIGASDRMKTVQAAQHLLEHVWPERDASAMLELVGNPAKRLQEDDNTELRKKLGHLLCPEYSALS